MLADLDAFLGWVVAVLHFGPDRGLGNALADPIDRGQTAQGFVRSVPVVVVHPLGQPIRGVWRTWINGCPELLQHGPLRPFDLAIQVRRARRRRTKLHRLRHETSLNCLGEKFGPAVSLYSLDRKRHLVEQLVEESQGRRRAPALRQASHQVAAAIVDSRELPEPGTDLARVHLHAVARNRTAVSLRNVAWPSLSWQRAEVEAGQNLMDRRCREAQAMQPLKLDTEPLDAKPPFTPQPNDHRLLNLSDFPRW